MSLVNDALKKARLEAARGEAANRSIPYPLLGRGEQPASRIWIVALGILALLVAAGGFFLFRAGERSALQANHAEPTPLAAKPEPTEPTVTAEPAAPLETGGSGEPSRPGPATETDLPTRSAPSRPQPDRPQPNRPQAAPARVVPETEARSAVADSDAGEIAPPPAQPRPSVATVTPDPVRRRPSPPEAAVATSQAPTEEDPEYTSEDSTEDSPEPSDQVEATPQPAAADDSPANDTAAREFLRKAEINGVGEIELGGIAWSGDRPFALINGRVVRPGDSVSGLLVEDIQPNTVRLQSDQGALVLKLK